MWKRLRRRWAKSARDRDRAAEIDAHLAAAVDHYVRQGMAPDAAARLARLRFGNPRAHQEQVDDMNRLPIFDGLGRDLSYAWRRVWQAPGFSATVIVTLALAIGATSAVFSLADRLLLRPLPLPAPQDLLVVGYERGLANKLYTGASVDGGMWAAVRDHVPAAETAVFTDGTRGTNFVAGGAPSFVQSQLIGANYFHTLGLRPLLGREFRPEEAAPNGAPSAILAFRFWQRVFHGDPAAVGQSIALRGEPYTVVGIMPPGASGIDALGDPDVWTPLREVGQGFNYLVLARPKAAETRASVAAQLASLDPRVAFVMQPAPLEGEVRHLVTLPLQDTMMEGAKAPIEMLGWAVATVLLIACVNIASLLMARGGERAKEIATRMALGSGRLLVVRQLMVESALLAALGGGLGVLVAMAGLEGLKAVGGTTFQEWSHVTLDASTVATALGLSGVTALLFGLLPAWQTSRIDVQASLADSGSRSIAGGSRNVLRRALVVAEVALGVVMLVAAGLLLRQFIVLRTLDPGFTPSHLYAVSASLQDARYKAPAAVNQLFAASLEKMRQAPGIQRAAVSQGLPYQRLLNVGFKVVGRPNEPSTFPITNVTYVTPDFFDTFGIAVTSGRALNDRDTAGMPQVVVANHAFAAFYFPGADALGQRLTFGRSEVEIVGISRDVQTISGFALPGMRRGAISTAPTLYLPAAQTQAGILSYFPPVWTVRADSPAAAAAALTTAINAVDPLLPLADVQSLESVASKSIAEPRLMMTLVGVLALAALLLAAIGIHGLITHVVSERVREFGIRLALGASMPQIVRSVAWSGVAMAGVGAAIGVVGAFFTATLVRAFLMDLTTTDPLTYAAVALTLVLVAVVASVVPALRLIRLDPAKALR